MAAAHAARRVAPRGGLDGARRARRARDGARAHTRPRRAQVLLELSRRASLAMPFAIGTLIWLMVSSLGERRAGDASAYSVFNRDFRALPGQLRAEDFERELLHQQ